MIFPTLHLNGTHPKDLFREYMAAMEAVGAAAKAVHEITVNGRDYYPQGPEAFAAARNEHSSRLEKLDQIKDELGEIMLYIGANAPTTGSRSLEAP